MNWEMISGVIRHIAGFAAGALVSAGLFNAAQTETIIGVLMGIAALIWSVLAKKLGWGTKATATALAFVGGGAALTAANVNWQGALMLAA